MDTKKTATAVRIGKILAMFTAASLLLLLPPLWGRQSDTGKPTRSGRFVLNGSTVSVEVPGDWSIHPEDPSSGFTGFSVVLKSSHGEIAIGFAFPGELRPSDEDSRQPRWLADRYAATWRLPLQQWVTPAGLEARDTLKPGKNRTRYVASGHSGDLEFAAFGTVSSSHDLKVVRNAVASFLASAEYSSKPSRPKVLVSGMKLPVSVKQVPRRIDPTVLTMNRRRLTLPNGWVPYDMTLPGFDLKPERGDAYRLDIVRVSIPDAWVNLSIQWAAAPLDSEARRTFVRLFKVRAQNQNWKESGYSVRDLRKATNTSNAADFYQMRIRRKAGKGSGKVERIELLYIAKSATVYGTALNVDDSDIEGIQKAFDAVRRQIKGR